MFGDKNKVDARVLLENLNSANRLNGNLEAENQRLIAEIEAIKKEVADYKKENESLNNTIKMNEEHYRKLLNKRDSMAKKVFGVNLANMVDDDGNKAYFITNAIITVKECLGDVVVYKMRECIKTAEKSHERQYINNVIESFLS